MLPPLILAINIIEAVTRDFQVGATTQFLQLSICTINSYYIGGSWNYMNAIAGILNTITITAGSESASVKRQAQT